MKRPFCRCRASACHRSRNTPTPLPPSMIERGIRANAQRLHEAFAWKQGVLKKYFPRLKGQTPKSGDSYPYSRKEGWRSGLCHLPRSLLLAEAPGLSGARRFMFSHPTHETPFEDFLLAHRFGRPIINLDDLHRCGVLSPSSPAFPRRCACATTPEAASW